MFLFNISQINNETPERFQKDKFNYVGSVEDYLLKILLRGANVSDIPNSLTVDPKPEDKSNPNPNSTPEYKKGDVNNDGKIDAEDLKKIIQISKDDNADPTSPEYSSADLNDDGIVDADDIKLMKKRIKGPKSGDFTYDGNVDIEDLNRLKDFKDGKILFTDAEKKTAGDGNVQQYIDELSKRFKERAKGDIDGNGKIDDEDIKLVTSALYEGYVLTDAEKDAGDYDENTQFNREDLKVLQKLLEPRAKGDINGDGKITEADVDVLNKVDGKHFILSQAQLDAAGMASNTISEKEKAVKELMKRFNVKTDGDVNQDKKLTLDDVEKLKEIIKNVADGKEILTDSEKSAYDFNHDGKVDEKDLTILSNRFKDRAIKGDINGDGVVNQQDLNMIEAYLKGDILFTHEPGKHDEFWAADMNDDGNVKGYDPNDPLDDIHNDFWLLSQFIQKQQNH